MITKVDNIPNTRTAVEQIVRPEGVLPKKTVDVIIPFYNEEMNVAGAHSSAEKLERLFQINHFIYINNGSKDNTLKELEKLREESLKVKIVQIDENIGYGNGFKKGFEASTSDYVITNHADQQFDAFGFYSGIVTQLTTLPAGTSVFSERRGRPVASSLFTSILRMVLSVVLGQSLKEFNGQPKLIERASMTMPIDQFPNDFAFDLMLYLASRNKIFYPISERHREMGNSSWNHGLGSKFRLFKSYLKSAHKMKDIIQTAYVKN